MPHKYELLTESQEWKHTVSDYVAMQRYTDLLSGMECM